MKQRCKWVGTDLLYIEYHDNEWGIPCYRKAFNNFDAEQIAEYDTYKIAQLLSNKGIIRNRLKIEAAVQNAVAFLVVQKEFGSFDTYIWRFVGNKPIRNAWKIQEEIPTKTKASIAISNDLRTRGFTFAGPTICYAFMQAAGMVNDHTINCFRYSEILQYEKGTY